MTKLLLYITLTFCSIPLFAYQIEEEKNELYLNALRDLKHRIDSVIAANQDSFKLQKSGELDEKKLKLFYPHFSSPNNNSVERGMLFQLHPQLIEEEKELNFNHSWHFLNLGLIWHWSLPGRGGFNSDCQQMIMLQVREAFRPISAFENQCIRTFLKDRGTGGKVLNGKGKLSLKIDYSDDGMIEIKAVSNSPDIFSISKLFEFQYVVDDSIYNHHIPLGFAVNIDFSRSNPFQTIVPFKSKPIKTIHPPLINTDGRKLRVIATFKGTSWVDRSPTFHDGRAIVHDIKDAWTGTILSNEIYLLKTK